MSGRLHKGFATILVVVLAMTAFGCSGDKPKETSGGDIMSSGSHAQSGSSAADEDEPYAVQMLVWAGNFPQSSIDADIGQYIRDEFGVVFDFVQYAGDMREKGNLMLAGGDYGELQTLSGNDMVMSYIKASALLELDPYLNQMPDFTARYAEKLPYWRVPGEGKLYKWESGIPNEIMEHNDIAVRTDVLEKYGWDRPLSTDEWVAFLNKAKADFPQTEEGLPTVGITMPLAEAWGLQGIVPILYEKGEYYTAVGNDGYTYNLKTKQIEDYFQNKYVKESFQFFNTLYREGLLDEECFTDTFDKTVEKMQQGRALASWYITWAIPDANAALSNAGKEKQQYLCLPVQSNSQVAEGQKYQLRMETTRPSASYGLTKNCKDPQKLLAVINWACSDEGQIMLRNGREGTYWTRDARGKRQANDLLSSTLHDPQASLKAGLGVFPFLPVFTIKASDGQYHDLTQEPIMRDKAGLTDRQKEAVQKLGWENSNQWYEENGCKGETGFASSVQIDPTSDLGKVHQKMVEIRTKNTAKMIMAESPDAFEKAYSEAMAEYDKLDHQAVIDELNRQLDEMQSKVDQYK